MAFDRNAGGHAFNDQAGTCEKCGMSRKQFDDTGKRCEGRRPPPSREDERSNIDQC